MPTFCGAEIGIFQDILFNTMAADASGPWAARESATIVLNMQNRSLSSMGNDFNYLCLLKAEKW